MPERIFDVVLWGATGFTGRLVAEHLHTVYGANNDLRWAIAGRNRDRLEALRAELNAPSLPILVGDSHDADSLRDIANRTRVVCSTVGPYLKYGEPLVAACARVGTDYCDLTGEVLFIRTMIDKYDAVARDNGARLCHSCGFDSIPSDLGAWHIQREFSQRHGSAANTIHGRVRRLRGAMSGGTVSSMLNLIDIARRNKEVRRLLANPYALVDSDTDASVRVRDQHGARYDEAFDAWTAPFIMAGINTRNVYRTHALLGQPWGTDFSYDEAMLTGRGLRGRWRAMMVSGGLKAFVLAASLGPMRRLMQSTVLPEPGEGPDEAARRSGFFVLDFEARSAAGERLTSRVTGERDPGYGATSRMLGETAACLALDLERETPGGCWTPAALLGDSLINRLQRNAGIAFSLLNDGDR